MPVRYVSAMFPVSRMGKAIACPSKHGNVTSSTMNAICAAGTGSFIEEQAIKLGCPILDYSKRTESAKSPLSSDRCTVFMERDMNHFLTLGYNTDQVLASALHSARTWQPR